MPARKTTGRATGAAATKAAPKPAAPARKGPLPQPSLAPRAPGERRHWLVKSEPDVFSWDDLQRAPRRTTGWEGVRNFLARNFLRDGFRKGDRVLFYHSNAEPPAVMGVCEVVREAFPDPTQFDPASEYHDPKATPGSAPWVSVELRAVAPFARPVPLDTLKADPRLDGFELVRRGSRLSVMPVSPAHWAVLCALGGVSP